MRLGGQVFIQNTDPQSWAAAIRQEGYRAAVCPVQSNENDTTIQEYRAAAEHHGLLIAEVGAWSNPISPDHEVRCKALEYCKAQLDLAERIGARVCVNIAGSRGAQWDGPHPDNFSDDTFSLIVDTVREIIDAVKPKSAYYALETMPWVLPDSADTYLALVKAIDREQFAVHLDPVNMIASPRIYYRNAEMITDFFTKLRPYIKSAHAKDIRLGGNLTVHLEEVLPGTGALDYKVFLSELSRLDPDTPLIIEHLPDEVQYRKAAAFIRETAASLQIEL
ncbi:sugar phosphate isomerase/epimerase [Paenibacillus zeisoli]|uniref:Sugar phosphate isomerase/epimerase n=1 Tax=Paenibacillus zeisoli TaxID=2496267 RepID=A0A433X4W8_9BACL|nr:sugar phosphate isomerase/epimerase family protein [Paenibacillus zeisoli]RUT29061.1 sugar phosphate isomerase/epimerase [Paenibacillus zeisoli]